MNETGKEIAKIAQIANRLSARVMREEGLGSAESDLVRLVREQPGISQKMAGESLSMDKGAVARRAVNLEKKGYLTRKNNPADARSQLLYPTEQAERIRDSDASAEEAFYQWLFDMLPDAERAAFYDTVHKLCQNAELESNDGFPNVSVLLGRTAFETENVPKSRPRKPAREKKAGNTAPDGAGLDGRQESAENAVVNETSEAAENQNAASEDSAGNQKTKTRKEPDVWLL